MIKAAIACCAMKADVRWCLTDTPILNPLNDLFSQVKFLLFELFSQWKMWNTLLYPPLCFHKQCEVVEGMVRLEGVGEGDLSATHKEHSVSPRRRCTTRCSKREVTAS
jgi:SNF2 family DNA or RNA helicase